MMESLNPDLLTFAESVYVKKDQVNITGTGGAFKKFFCSTLDEKTSFCTDSKIFGRLPSFEPRTKDRPVVAVKPVERKPVAEVN